MSLVLFEVRDNVALITMNNPDKRNMLTTRASVSRLSTAWLRLSEHPEVKALIVTGDRPSLLCRWPAN